MEGGSVLAAALSQPAVPRRRADGAWEAMSEDGWRFRSELEGLIFDREEALQILRRASRAHIEVGYRLSVGRCLVLAEEAPSVWRLWQVARLQTSLVQAARSALLDERPNRGAETLLKVAKALAAASRSLALSRLGWDGEPAEIGLSSGRVVFLGFVPSRLAGDETWKDPQIRLRQGLMRLLPPLLRECQRDCSALRAELSAVGERLRAPALAERLERLLAEV